MYLIEENAFVVFCGQFYRAGLKEKKGTASQHWQHVRENLDETLSRASAAPRIVLPSRVPASIDSIDALAGDRDVTE